MRRSRAGARNVTGIRMVLTILLVFILIIGAAFTAANVVPVSDADQAAQPTTANDLKPPECDALDLTAVVGGSGAVVGSDANELLLGSELIDTIDGGGGGDCLVGGPADDVLTGGAGVDICLGNDGADTFLGCETEYQ